MGVYIKGIEMPKSCLSCPLQGGTADCRLTQKTYNWGLPERPSDCPLVPVPPHGDLVDLKAPFKAQYYDEMTEEWLEKTVTVEDALYGCMVDEMPPTIIPAEEGET